MNAIIKAESVSVPRALRTIEAVLSQATAPKAPRPNSHGTRQPIVERDTCDWPALKLPLRIRFKRRATSAEVSNESSRKSMPMRAVASNAAHQNRHAKTNQGTNTKTSCDVIRSAQGLKGTSSACTTGLATTVAKLKPSSSSLDASPSLERSGNTSEPPMNRSTRPAITSSAETRNITPSGSFLASRPTLFSASPSRSAVAWPRIGTVSMVTKAPRNASGPPGRRIHAPSPNRNAAISERSRFTSMR